VSLNLLLDNPTEVLAKWPREPLRSHRDPAAFEHLITLDEINRLVDADCLALRNVALLKDSKIVEKAAYADGDMPRRGALRAHLNAGGTLSLRQLERFSPAIARLYDDLRQETGFLVHVNAYLTPPGCQGLKYHYDPYVTLILQLSGSKTWPVHRPFTENPVREYGSYHEVGFTSEQLEFLAYTAPLQSFTLEPGDVLWLPRGWVHSPYTEGAEPSLHLTVAFKERTYHWLAGQIMAELLAQALVDPEMRQEVPPAELTSAPGRAVEEMRAYLIGALLRMDQGEAAELVRAAARHTG
jgi:ribosomal protein L16 Arg81 hydroxylase